MYKRLSKTCLEENINIQIRRKEMKIMNHSISSKCMSSIFTIACPNSPNVNHTKH